MNIVKRLPQRHIFDLQPKRYSNTYIALICFLTALTFITICSEMSFLCAFPDNEDIHCFFTVGNSMLHGYVPYRDIYEQKGPILYMFFAICAFISDTSFIGVYIFEVLFFTVFLYIAYKTIQLFRNVSIVWIVVLGTIICSVRAFTTGGEAEEFMLPLLMYAIYVVAKSIKTDTPIPYRSAFFIGITSALIFWTKYTILGFYFGLALTVIILRAKKDGRKLFYAMLSLIGGVLVVSIPVLCYFLTNNAVNDLFLVYFYNNMTLYTKGSLLNNLGQGLCSFAISNALCFFLLFIAIIYGIKKRKEKYAKEILLLILSTAVFYFLIAYFGGRYYYYYSLPFDVFSPFGIIVLCDYGTLITNKLKDKSLPLCLQPIFSIFICIICIICPCIFSYNTYYKYYEKEDLPQFQFAEIINQESNPTLLTYNLMDSGFYTASKVLPPTKYFSWLNVRYDEIMNTQNEIIKNGEVDFVVTYNEELDTPLYTEVTQSYYEPYDFLFRLYKLV